MNNEAFVRFGSSNLGGHSILRRQFAAAPTRPQRTFDVVFGLLVPVLCFYFDPIVFQGNFIGEPLYSDYQMFAYIVTAIEVLVLALWLFGPRMRVMGALLGGVLIAGSAFSAVVGIAILPFSLLGLMILIGVLGFIPFLTAFVYLRNGLRALWSDVDYEVNRSWLTQMAMGMVLALGLPGFVGVQVTRTLSTSIDAIICGGPSEAEIAVHRLKWLPFVPQQKLNQIVASYRNDSDENRKSRLKRCYREITGEDIEDQAPIFND
ncbi:MAG: hypothetical protein QOD75_2979 [Blastocatellia bacterium]|jgi:hypothetical protein|nr:hypothetical protein [Blastocatellia bacterium]